MNRFILLVGILFVTGCSSIDPVKNIIRDPQFTDYQTTMDQLEKDYLHKKISYADYLTKKKHVEEEYQMHADSRREVIENKGELPQGTEPAL